MIRHYCDKCGKQESKSLPIQEYQLLAKIEATREDHEKEQDYAIEFESLEVCQPCVGLLVIACKEFIQKNKGGE